MASEPARQPAEPLALASLAPATGLNKLRRFLQAHLGHFTLALVRANREDVKEELVRWTRRFCQENRLELARLDYYRTSKSHEDFLTRLSGLPRADAVYLLTGLDEEIHNGAGRLANLLNRQRERLAEWLPGPVLLVLGDLAMDRFLIEAPDLADWYAAGFEFERPGRDPGSDLPETGAERWSPLSTETIEARIATLERQLESGQLPTSAQARIWLDLAGLYRESIYSVPKRPPSSRRRSRDQGMEKAAGAAEEAVRRFRVLAAARPSDFLPHLAISLNTWANRLRDLGLAEKAVGAAQEAVSIRRGLSDANPGVYLPDLAKSLNSLSYRLADQGRRTEALAAAEESVRIRRDLAAFLPEALPDLSRSLDSLSKRLTEVGRREDALVVNAECLDIRRGLASNEPAHYLPDLARSLSSLSGELAEMGRQEEAIAAAEESVSIRRQLAESTPHVYLPDLARSLKNLARQLSKVGRRGEALSAADESVRIYRQVVAASASGAIDADLAGALIDVSNILREQGLRHEALAAADEAGAQIDSLKRQHGPAFPFPGLVPHLVDLADCLSSLERHDQAIATAEYAVALCRDRFEPGADAIAPALARSLGSLGRCLMAANLEAKGLAALRQGIEELRELYLRFPLAFGSQMRSLVCHYESALKVAGQKPDVALLSPIVRVLDSVTPHS